MKNTQVVFPPFKPIGNDAVVKVSAFKLMQGVYSSDDWTAFLQNGSSNIPNRPHSDDYLPKEIQNQDL